MEKNHVILITIFSTLLLIGLFPVNPSQGLVSAVMLEQTIIYVDDSNILGPWNGTIDHPFQRIQDGINVSSDNDIIYIFDGIYNESLLIYTSITLYGEKTTIINGNYRPILITANSEDVILQNLMIQNSGGYPDNTGLLLNSHHIVIINTSYLLHPIFIQTDERVFFMIAKTFHSFSVTLAIIASTTVEYFSIDAQQWLLPIVSYDIMVSLFKSLNQRESKFIAVPCL